MLIARTLPSSATFMSPMAVVASSTAAMLLFRYSKELRKRDVTCHETREEAIVFRSVVNLSLM